jgi:prepilin-type N-terminal cleavage/methylation domain-containing protein
MKNKGFTLIEVLTIIAIMGILISVILASVSENKESKDVINSTYLDDRNSKFEKSAIQKTTESVDVNTSDDPCYGIDNSEIRSQCVEENYKSKKIQECVELYS